MGWSLGFDSHWERYIGYGVPAYCDHPGCMKKIDRGLYYVCGGEPYGGDEGCGLYFCGEHLYFYENKGFVCKKCGQNRKPFEPKQEHPEWLMFLLTDESWAEWRRTKNRHYLKELENQFYL